MPFFNQIANFINDTLKAGSLNNAKLQPAKYYGISTVVARKKDAGAPLEMLPAIVEDGVVKNLITPDSKMALQLYHKLISNVYAYEKKSFGDEYNIKCASDMMLVVICNSKLTGKGKEALEPVVLFGLPQRISTALQADLQIIKCLLSPVSSNMDAVAVFKQEYPQAEYFLNENVSMFSIRYKVEMNFSQACVDKCLCD